MTRAGRAPGRRLLPWAISWSLTGIATGCSFAPPPETPPTVAELPDRYSQAEATGAYDPQRWWQGFGDPVLDRLVDRALEANLDLRQAVARLEEVGHRYRIARSAFYPSVGPGADVTRSSQPSNTGFAGQFTGGDEERPEGEDPPPGTPVFGDLFGGRDRFDFTTYSVSLGFSYELDFWGRVSSETKAAIGDYLATRADVETARLSVIAGTISNYFEILELRRQVELTTQNVDLLRERAELTDERYLRGLVTSFELYSILQQYRNVQSSLPVLEARLFEAEGRLAVLLGRYAGRIDDLLEAESTPSPDLGSIPAELPAALLTQRPDVRAAAARMEAARYRIGARRAELYPTISFNGSAGLQAGGVNNLFRVDQYFLNLIGGLFAPIFQGGRLRANVGVAEAQYVQQAAAYVRTVLTAYKEVEASLQNLEKQSERFAFLEEQRESAQASVDFQLRRFRRGVGDYVSYLDARRNLVSSETNLTLAARALGEARLAVHRALGGDWVRIEEAADAELAEIVEGGR